MLVTITGEPVPGRDEKSASNMFPVPKGMPSGLNRASPRVSPPADKALTQGVGLYVLAAGLFALIALTLGAMP